MHLVWNSLGVFAEIKLLTEDSFSVYLLSPNAICAYFIYSFFLTYAKFFTYSSFSSILFYFVRRDRWDKRRQTLMHWMTGLAWQGKVYNGSIQWQGSCRRGEKINMETWKDRTLHSSYCPLYLISRHKNHKKSIILYNWNCQSSIVHIYQTSLRSMTYIQSEVIQHNHQVTQSNEETIIASL